MNKMSAILEGLNEAKEKEGMSKEIKAGIMKEIKKQDKMNKSFFDIKKALDIQFSNTSDADKEELMQKYFDKKNESIEQDENDEMIEEAINGTSKGDKLEVVKNVFKSPFEMGTVWICKDIKKTNIPGESEVYYTEIDKEGNETKNKGILFTSLIDAGIKLGAIKLVKESIDVSEAVTREVYQDILKEIENQHKMVDKSDTDILKSLEIKFSSTSVDDIRKIMREYFNKKYGLKDWEGHVQSALNKAHEEAFKRNKRMIYTDEMDKITSELSRILLKIKKGTAPTKSEAELAKYWYNYK